MRPQLQLGNPRVKVNFNDTQFEAVTVLAVESKMPQARALTIPAEWPLRVPREAVSAGT